MGIFDELDFVDLAAMAALRPRYQQLIIDHYILLKYQLNDAAILISLSNNDHTHIYYTPTTDLSQSIKLTTGCNELLSTLKAFCHLFSRLTFNANYYYSKDLHLIQQIADVINNYCSNVPQTIAMELDTENLGFSFENATNIKLGSPENYTATELNRCFPRMEELSMRIGRPFTLDHHLPHLIHFEVKQMFYGQFDLKTFGEYNPQIRGITMKLPWDIEHLREINGIFENLEVLDIQVHRIRKKSPSIADTFGSLFGKSLTKPAKEIRFRNVKKFTINISKLYHYRHGVDYSFDIIQTDWIRDKLSILKFDQLESFTFVTNSQTFVEEQIDLITSNRGLITVDFSTISLNFEQMVRLVDNLPKLTQVTLKCYKAETIDDIWRLMEMETSLNVMHVVVNRERRETFLALTSLPRDWRLDIKQMTSSYHLTFEQKKK